MPKRSSIEPEGTDDIEAIVRAGKNPHAVALGRLGGKKGGPARAERLSPEQRSEIARHAARVRWSQEAGDE